MIKKLKTLFVFFAMLSLAGCGTMMKDVLSSCDQVQEFGGFVYCVKNKYNNEGRDPNHANVRAFYANLDVIEEAYRAKKITNAQAKSYAYDAFNKTIQAGNDRADAASANYFNALGAMQQQQQQIRTPVQTNCYRNGAYTNCTSY
jgi:hypothetical protein